MPRILKQRQEAYGSVAQRFLPDINSALRRMDVVVFKEIKMPKVPGELVA